MGDSVPCGRLSSDLARLIILCFPESELINQVEAAARLGAVQFNGLAYSLFVFDFEDVLFADVILGHDAGFEDLGSTLGAL